MSSEPWVSPFFRCDGGMVHHLQDQRAIALTDPAVRKAFLDGDVAAVRADWTRENAGITRLLEANGRAAYRCICFIRRLGQ